MKTLAYLLSIVGVNILFTVVPPIPLPIGGVWSFATLAVGATFILRDYADEEIGSWVIAASFAGALISAAFNPALALVSGGSFFLAELADMAVFRRLKGATFYQKVAWSQAAGITTDTGIFLAGLAWKLDIPWSWASFVTMVAGKAIALVYIRGRR